MKNTFIKPLFLASAIALICTTQAKAMPGAANNRIYSPPSPSFNQQRNFNQPRFNTPNLVIQQQNPAEQKRVLSEHEIVQLLKYGVQKGNVDAMYNLGLRMVYGDNHVEQDTKKAFELLKKARDEGKEEADFYLALLYIWGDGDEASLEENVKQGANILRKLAGEGDEQARAALERLEKNEDLKSEDYAPKVEEISAQETQQTQEYTPAEAEQESQ